MKKRYIVLITVLLAACILLVLLFLKEQAKKEPSREVSTTETGALPTGSDTPEAEKTQGQTDPSVSPEPTIASSSAEKTAAPVMPTPTAVPAAATEPILIVTDAQAKPGAQVTIAIRVENNPGFITARLALNQDVELRLVSANDTGLLNGGLFGRELSAKPFYLYWDDALAEGNNQANGEIVLLTYEVSADAAPGKYNVWLTWDENELFDYDLNNVSFLVKNGVITVSA